MMLARTITSHVMAGFTAIALYMLACQTFHFIDPMCRLDNAGAGFYEAVQPAKKGK